MENLNAEQVKKALECCLTTSEGDCIACRYRGKKDKLFITCTNILMADALALINSQEQRIKELEQECKKWQGRLKIECEYTEKITVKKMHSMLCEGRVSNDNVVIVANQVAKEMLEGV